MSAMKRVYLAGPMRGLPQFNYPAFLAAAGMLRARGYHVFNPAECDMDTMKIALSPVSVTGDENEAAKHGFNRRTALLKDLSWVCATAEAVVLLPGWEASLGALAEVATARALSLPVITLEEALHVV